MHRLVTKTRDEIGESFKVARISVQAMEFEGLKHEIKSISIQDVNDQEQNLNPLDPLATDLTKLAVSLYRICLESTYLVEVMFEEARRLRMTDIQ